MWPALIIASLCAITYCARYRSYPRPPTGDFISPLVLLTLAAGVVFFKETSIPRNLILMSLMVDTFADYMMNEQGIDFSILFFSLGHLLRQFVFMYVFYPWGSIGIFLITLVILICMMCVFEPMSHLTTRRYSNIVEEHIMVVLYAATIGLTLLNASSAKGSLSLGLTLFVISDLIIAYELIWAKIKYRTFRIIAVPALFWIAEVSIIYELLN